VSWRILFTQNSELKNYLPRATRINRLRFGAGVLIESLAASTQKLLAFAFRKSPPEAPVNFVDFSALLIYFPEG